MVKLIDLPLVSLPCSFHAVYCSNVWWPVTVQCQLRLRRHCSALRSHSLNHIHTILLLLLLLLRLILRLILKLQLQLQQQQQQQQQHLLLQIHHHHHKVNRLKLNKAIDENSSLSYGKSPPIVLPATRHKWTRPALTPASKLVLDLPTPEAWKAELT